MDRPIIFSTDMVKAILDGRKTQTRRVIKPQPFYTESRYWLKGKIVEMDVIRFNDYVGYPNDNRGEYCPYGRVGDRLWVRETWFSAIDKKTLLGYVADGENPHDCGYYVKPSIFMPRAASRINLEITGLRVQRIQEIKSCYGDVAAEGFNLDTMGEWDRGWLWFRSLWDKINAKRGYGWESNPYVWAITFKVIEPYLIIDEGYLLAQKYSVKGK